MEDIEDLHFKGLKLVQDKSLFCFGIDAVLLSSFAHPHKKDKVIDLCTGNGIVPILMSGKTEAESFTGIELQEKCAALADKSVRINNLEGKIKIINADIKDVKKILSPSCADVITVNPPYMKGQTDISLPENATAREIARHELFCSLEDVAEAAFYLLKSTGTIYMIHRPNRLAEIFTVLSNHHLEPKRMRLVLPFEKESPSMVLIEARKEAKAGIVIEKPLVIYEKKNVYTEEVLGMYGKL